MGVQINGDTGNISAIKADYSGNVTIGGTLTYEDVTNIDSVGLITAREGIEVGARPGVAASISVDGNMIVSGITTFGGAISGTTATFSGAITGDGSGLTGIAATDNVRTGILDVAGVSTFRNTVNIGAAVTISESGIEASGIGITVANINGTHVGGRRNLIDNGAMRVAQRGTYYPNVDNNETTIDRFSLIHPYGDYFDVTQSTDSPDGFSKSYKLDINTVDSSIGSGQYVAIRQRIEAQNLQQLAFGTSAAKPITLSFYVRSNKTGTFAINIQQTDNSSKQVSQPYTISSANTWERKTFTFAGDTSGVINDDGGTGLTVIWWLSAGSTYNSGTSRSTFTTHADADAAVGCNVNILDNTSNNFYLTGVQLEVGSQATDFEHMSIAEELAICHRYLFVWSSSIAYSNFNMGYTTSATGCETVYLLPAVMRDTPTLATSGTFRLVGYNYNAGQVSSSLSSIEITRSHTRSPYLRATCSGMSVGQIGEWGDNGSNNATMTFSAEL